MKTKIFVSFLIFLEALSGFYRNASLFSLQQDENGYFLL